MAHTQPSPTAAMVGHGHLAAHPQVNGHVHLQPQAQKAPVVTTAQRIAALNEQVWLQIGMCRFTQCGSYCVVARITKR